MLAVGPSMACVARVTRSGSGSANSSHISLGQVALLEDPDEHAIRGTDRQQIEHDRLQLDDD